MRKIVWEIDKSNSIVMELRAFGKNRIYYGSRIIKEQFTLFKNVEFELDDGRTVILKAKHAFAKLDFVLLVGGELQVSNDKAISSNCPSCKGKVGANDKFCEACGAELPKFESHIANSSVKEAKNTILALAVLFAIFGGFMFLVQKGQADTALTQLQQFQPTDIFPQPINGEKITVAELRSQIQIEKWGVLWLNLFLASLMLVLSFWAKRSPLAALLVATSVYVSIQVLNALYDPTTIAQGIIMKIIIISFLVKGIKSALQIRAMERSTVV